MKQFAKILFYTSLFVGTQIIQAQTKTRIKKEITKSIDKHQDEMIAVSDQIWEAAETSLEEYKSSDYLIQFAEQNGFKVEKGVAGIPTAFTATYGTGKPVIGILGEFDANAGISQKKQPTREARIPGGAGHGCGHNLFGTASLGAAIAIKEQIEEGTLKGTVVFYGTPAEETIFAKVWMAREGLFDDLDVCMDWHPGDGIEAATQSSKALVDFRVKFYGSSSHASSDPWNGKSAVDAMELYTTGLNYYREHIKPTARIHYHIEKAGDVVNVVPDFAQIWTRLRENDRPNVDVLYERAKKIAEGAALMAGVRYEIQLISGIYEIQVNRTGAEVMQDNIETLGPITYTDSEVAYANTILKETNKPQKGLDGEIYPLRPSLPAQGGSTDVGDVSQLVPTIRMTATVASKGGPWHSWAVVACTGMSIGHKGMLYASKALGMTMVDLFKDPALIKRIKEDFKNNKTNSSYDPRIPAGPPSLN
ncbi:amidohydrolase [Flavobacteriaceae bacterium]|nr:amidohydrolase [Flavobacteriaceae bacterium]MDB4643838.1 amidohydrolase [Flavobacteriaceae bacterium]